MGRGRQLYYDVFSRVYDRFVALHSGDGQRSLRAFLAGLLPDQEGGSVLDLCTGTGVLLPFLAERLGPEGRVVGLDFSRGMLRHAGGRKPETRRCLLVQADAAILPFADGSCAAVTCSHAFYELKGGARDQALREITRVLAPGGLFLMMEHDVPAAWPARPLFYLRLFLAGGRGVRAFLREEQAVLASHFRRVDKVPSPTGRSKVMLCRL